MIVLDAFRNVYKLPAMGNVNLSDDESTEEPVVFGNYFTVADVSVSSSLVATGDRDFSNTSLSLAQVFCR